MLAGLVRASYEVSPEEPTENKAQLAWGCVYGRYDSLEESAGKPLGYAAVVPLPALELHVGQGCGKLLMVQSLPDQAGQLVPDSIFYLVHPFFVHCWPCWMANT